MEIPGFQVLAVRGIALGRREGAPAVAGPGGSEGPWQEAPAGPSPSENKEWVGPSIAEARLSLYRDDEGDPGLPLVMPLAVAGREEAVGYQKTRLGIYHSGVRHLITLLQGYSISLSCSGV